MLLKQKSSRQIVEVVNYINLVDLNCDEVVGRFHEGEEPRRFKKQDLFFLSGEELPRCWVDSHYRDDELKE